MKEQLGWEEMYFDWGPSWDEVPGRYKGVLHPHQTLTRITVTVL